MIYLERQLILQKTLACANELFYNKLSLKGVMALHADDHIHGMSEEEHAALHALGVSHEHSHEMTDAEHAALHAQGVPHEHAHTHSHEHTAAVLNRLSRAIGHMQAVKRMVEEGRDCAEVLVQIAAVRSAIDNTGKLILQDHLKHCIVEAAQENDQQAIDDLCKAIDKFMK